MNFNCISSSKLETDCIFFHSCHLPEKLGTKLLGLYHLVKLHDSVNFEFPNKLDWQPKKGRNLEIIKTILYFLDLPTNRDLKLIVFAFFSQLPSTREVGNQAAWSLSSCKPGFGVEQIRDDNYETYWQSDGQLPHLVNIQFKRKTTVSAVAIYTDFR